MASTEDFGLFNYQGMEDKPVTKIRFYFTH